MLCQLLGQDNKVLHGTCLRVIPFLVMRSSPINAFESMIPLSAWCACLTMALN